MKINELSFHHHLFNESSINDSSLNITNAINNITSEFMPLLAGGLPIPKFKINNRQGKVIGACHWQYGIKDGKPYCWSNTEIELQKRAVEDTHTLRRIIAHELCHHEDFLINDTNYLNNYGYQSFKLHIRRTDSHGVEWLSIAHRFNNKYGDNFVTKTSDQDFKLATDNLRPFYVLITKYNDKLGWQVSLRLSPKQIIYLNACANHKLSYDNKRLFMSSDAILLDNGAPMKIYGGFSIPRTDEQKSHILNLWNTGPDILSRYK